MKADINQSKVNVKYYLKYTFKIDIGSCGIMAYKIDNAIIKKDRNGKITLIDDDGDYTEGTYSLSGNKLTMSILGESNSTYINLSGNTFKSDIDETEFYQEAIEYLIENSNDVVVSKVITTYTYKRK